MIFSKPLTEINESLDRRKYLDNALEMPQYRPAKHYEEFFNEVVIPTLTKDNKIRVIVPASIKDRRYCHCYVFGFSEPEEKMNNFFFENILQKDYEQILKEVVQQGNLVIYWEKHPKSNLQILKHSGVFNDNDVVQSKWGAGAVLEHGIFDVPTRYGTHVSYFRRIC